MDLKDPDFDELIAYHGHKNRSAFGRSCGVPRSVLSLYAQGWPGTPLTRRMIKAALQVDDKQLNAAILRSWKAYLRSIPREK